MFDRANPPLAVPNAPVPTQGFVIATLLIVSDIERSRAFYEKVFDGEVVREGSPTTVRIANSWVIINSGGGPTDDKPSIIAVPPQEVDKLTIAMNFRVADVHACYELWRSRGADFLTEPKQRETEIRCYIRDPDGYLIEVGQTTKPVY